MKVNELRAILSKQKKEDLVKIAAEFYKLIPKAKKEEYDLDNYVKNPNKAKKSAAKSTLTLKEIEVEVVQFIENATNQYYIMPNRIVPKKERATWRFKVKRWYKELINTKREDANLKKQAELLGKLYDLICESCGFNYFTAYDSFESIGIEQLVFYSSVIALLQEAEGKLTSVEKSIELIVNNFLNRYTLYSYLMDELISTYDITDLKYTAIEKTKKLLAKNNFVPESKPANRHYSFDRENFNKQEVNNNLAELGLRLYISLYEEKNGIAFFKKHYYDEEKEIKLYILIGILFDKKKKEQILAVMDEAIVAGIKPRQNLLDLVRKINEHGELPKYMR